MSEVEAIAEVLELHTFRTPGPEDATGCHGCDWRPVGLILLNFEKQTQHRAHVAELVARLAAADRDSGPRERVEALAAEWECEPNPSDYHRKACPGCHRGGRLRAALDASPTGDDA
jgi:hypothetical protein